LLTPVQCQSSGRCWPVLAPPPYGTLPRLLPWRAPTGHRASFNLCGLWPRAPLPTTQRLATTAAPPSPYQRFRLHHYGCHCRRRQRHIARHAHGTWTWKLMMETSTNPSRLTCTHEAHVVGADAHVLSCWRILSGRGGLIVRAMSLVRAHPAIMEHLVGSICAHTES